ncbi:MAG: hypothetical protein NC822_07255 [Candidatus Omnitrophica bacterium]|nr:hypothetical protein [Candidatus Omnitrophota bacterium]MCM8827511.1 hypothetical protein [Candidatus Omnitrophota bacterium]
MLTQEYSKNLKEIVSYLRKGKIALATQLIPKFTEILKSLLTYQDKEGMKYLAGVTRGILDSFQRKDYVLMADLIEYEVMPIIEKLGEGIS